MPSTTGHGQYDQSLLAAAPAATKTQIREGYDADLLNPNRGKATPPPVPTSASQTDLERGTGAEYNDKVTENKTVPFWRTTKGIITIVVALILIIIAAVVGGVVGGRKKTHNDSTTLPSNPVPTTGGGIGQSGSTTSPAAASSAAGPAVTQGAGKPPITQPTDPVTPTPTPNASTNSGTDTGSQLVASSDDVVQAKQVAGVIGVGAP